jgi:hypothetical protein
VLVVGDGFRAIDRDAQQGLLDQFHVGAVGPVHGQADRDALALDQQAALDALLGAVGGVFAGLFPPRGAPWSCTRPSTARTNRSPSNSHTPATRPSRTARRRRPEPILESGHGPWTPGRRWSRPGPSTGNPYATQKRWRPCRHGSACAACRHRKDAYSRVGGAAIRSPPTGHPECATPGRVQGPAHPSSCLHRSCQLHEKQEQLHPGVIATNGLSG